MSMTEVKAQLNHLGSAWEQFKQINDRRLEEVEKRGKADPLTEQQLSRINHSLDECKDRLGQMETAMQRPAFGHAAVETPHQRRHKEAFCNYLRKGLEMELATKSLSLGSDPDGGYLVSPMVSERIVKTVFETSPMRQLAHIETISTDSLEIIQDKDEAVAGWTSETASVSDTDTPEVAKKVIAVHELYAQPKATQKLIDDASVDIEAWLAEKVADVFSRKENTAFISGDGVGKPRGILTYDEGTSWGEIEQVSSGSNGTTTGDKIIQLVYSLKDAYMVHASFLMNRSTIQTVRQLKEDGSSNQYLWQPGLSAGTPDTLLGIPVMPAADMPVPSSNGLCIAVGDFSRAYTIVDRNSIHVLRDPFTDKPFVKFYTTKRVGGDVVNFEAIKLLKFSA